jgi:hypothetical protein
MSLCDRFIHYICHYAPTYKPSHLPSNLTCQAEPCLPLLSLTVEPPKGAEPLTIHMVRVLSLWSSASGPLLSSPLWSSTLKGPYQSSPLKGPLPMVEPPKGSLTVEPAYASLSVECAYAPYRPFSLRSVRKSGHPPFHPTCL